MAWERRGDSRKYYYSAARRGGRVVKTYHGKGAVGELAAGVVDASKRRRAGQAEALAAERARLEPAERALAALDETCRLAIEATLTAAGFHRYQRHWRRRRVGIQERELAGPAGRG